MSVAALSPVNKTAALVVSKGTHYEMNSKRQVKEYVGPPQMVAKHKLPKSAGFIDLAGKEKGRLKVLGLMAEDASKWVVRCVCGTYTTRSAKSIKSIDTNPNAKYDACRECMHLAYRKREEIYRRTGKDVNLSEVW